MFEIIENIIKLLFKKKKYIHIQQSHNYYTERNETNNHIPILSNEILCIMTNKPFAHHFTFVTTFIHYSIKSKYIKFSIIYHRLLKFNTLNRFIQRYIIIYANFL